MTIACVDENGNEIFVQLLTPVVGSRETINAPPLRGYALAAEETSSQVITIMAGENVVTFEYVQTGDGDPLPSASRRTSGIRKLCWWIPLVVAFLCGVGVTLIIRSRKKKKEEQE